MEAGTTPAEGTGSATIADLCAAAAARYGDQIAIKHKVDGAWRDVTFAQVGEIVQEIGLGLVALGLEPGERVAILCNTRPEWAYAEFAISSAGGVAVPIYPTNSPEECEWVAGNSESVFVVCEDAEQVAKVVAVRDRLPALRQIIVVDPSGDVADAISLDDVRGRGNRDEAQALADRTAAVRPDDPFTFIYTSGTTGPPKGCVLTHGNYRSVLDMVEERGSIGSGGDLIYLFLPLAHAFALLIQLSAVDLGVPIAYYGGDTKAIVGELMEVKPTYLPSVPRIFEKLYTLAQQQLTAAELDTIRSVGGQIQDLEVRGEPVPDALRESFAELAPKAAFVKGLFGGQIREAVTGAAPIAHEILEFFWGCGIPVMEGYGMTETSTVATSSRPEAHRFGSVGRPLDGVEVKIADDGELLIKGANIFRGYYKNDDASFGAVDAGWLHTGDLGSVDADGYVYITGRKKDIIITAGGKNLTPANLENDLKQTRWVSQAVMHGDRRPYPVMLITLDEEEIVPWAEAQGIEDRSIAALAENEQVRALLQEILDAANAKYAQVEQVKKFAILDHDLSQETGELTPTLKVKRNVVNDKYASLFDELY
ncbi:Long-chain-fatty-acid--CoA ligase FadD15 [Baekduia alba]|uniref:AMP-dependent synthetase/ligase n=1 Tax=Baekduia alba TaxID=2997333 RepID=UPI002341DC2E|nr:AMP-dependent synthetase/ligase [Baekduia alba]WCB96071.1 Long-chain-fatty-acid--CoA ligase FadD15 [Baekduia alba]